MKYAVLLINCEGYIYKNKISMQFIILKIYTTHE